jgi:hypothetical protein
MNETELLLKYFGEKQPFDSPLGIRISTAIAGLRDSRTNTRRDVNTGEFDPEITHGDIGNWLGAMGYMTVLEQLGTSLTLKNQDALKNRSSILRALTFFYSGMSELEIHALIALRNAFFHDFNLINIPGPQSRYKNEQTHRFVVYAHSNGKIVDLPSTHWDGNYENKSWDKDTETMVNLFKFGNLVENIVKNVRSKILLGQVETTEKNIFAFLNKYTFIIYPNAN